MDSWLRIRGKGNEDGAGRGQEARRLVENSWGQEEVREGEDAKL